MIRARHTNWATFSYPIAPTVGLGDFRLPSTGHLPTLPGSSQRA